MSDNVDRRHKDVDWEVADGEGAVFSSWDAAQLAVLMDIRDELQDLNSEVAIGFGAIRRLEKHIHLRWPQKPTHKPKKHKKASVKK